MHRFVVTIQGQDWTELDEVELLRPPDVGDTIETKFGLCLVTEAELSPGADHGTIACRLP